MQTMSHVLDIGPAAAAPSPFSILDDTAAYSVAVDGFLAASSFTTVPVWTGGRADLAASVERAASLYRDVSPPVPAPTASCLRRNRYPPGLSRLWHRLRVNGSTSQRLGSHFSTSSARRARRMGVESLRPMTMSTRGRCALC